MYKSIRVITNPLDGPSKAEIVYENGKINDVVEWSSDGNSVVFMEQGGATLDWGWAGGYAQSITSLNLSTGRAKELLLADHGQVYPNVSWSNDGNFIIYSIKLPTDRVDWVDIQVWWLEVATGKTGPITNTLDVFGATYRK